MYPFFSSPKQTLPLSIDIGDLIVYRMIDGTVLDIGLVVSFKFDEVVIQWLDGANGIYAKGFALEHKYEDKHG